MDYKNTLNLPQTGFPMKADLVTREPQRLAQWESAQLYQKIQAARANAEKFVLHDGPPFANGDVHIGTALNKILKDIIVKYHTLRGKSAPYVPGWDCHGLPIEFKVTQDMRKEFDAQWPIERKKHEDLWNGKSDPISVEAAIKSMALSNFMSSKDVRERCEAYAWKYIDLQRNQFKRLGVLGDWENPYLTLDKKYEANQLRLFAKIVEKGFVYRGKKPVYWSIPCRTALAEAEVEYHDHVSQSIYVKFPVVGREKTFILIWTTTPWTLPANLAVAYNKKFEYVEVTANGEKYILAKCRLEKLMSDQILPPVVTINPISLPITQISELLYHHSFCDRSGGLLPAEFVTDDTGTGFVHIAPGHGLDDYNLGMQNNLVIYSPVDDNGCFVWTDDLPYHQQMPENMLGKSILEKHGKSDANEAVLHELRLRHALLHQENYHHSYPFCWRSKTPIIFRAMDQWFIKIDHTIPKWVEEGEQIQADSQGALKGFAEDFGSLRGKAIREIDTVHWIPDWGKNRIRGAVESRPDWCISRQRSWGVPIPAFYDGKNWVLRPEIINKIADLFEKTGSRVWFETNDARQILFSANAKDLIPAELWTDSLKKSNDTLDVWIDSGSSSEAVLKARPELRHAKPGNEDWIADIYLEGSDQHRGWFQSSLLLSLAGNNAAPFKAVLTHGFMVDADREKISKSKQAQGGYEKPQTAEAYVKKYGADVVRLWVASQDYRNDIVVSDERINKVSETYRGIRNCLRYQLSNLYDFDPAKNSVPDDKLTGLDRWILSEFSKLEAAVIEAYEKYEFHVVYQKISQFVAVELSAIYHDVVKDRLYTDAANSHRRRSTQTALHRLVTGLCQMLSPILAFTADEAWEFVPKVSGSVHESILKPGVLALDSDEIAKWDWLKLWREKLLPELEKARQAKMIGKALDATIEMVIPKGQARNRDEELLRELLNVSNLKLEISDDAESFNVSKADGQKCERCWHWETDVGSDPAHPTICVRCVAAAKENLAGK